MALKPRPIGSGDDSASLFIVFVSVAGVEVSTRDHGQMEDRVDFFVHNKWQLSVAQKKARSLRTRDMPATCFPDAWGWT